MGTYVDYVVNSKEKRKEFSLLFRDIAGEENIKLMAPIVESKVSGMLLKNVEAEMKEKDGDLLLTKRVLANTMMYYFKTGTEFGYDIQSIANKEDRDGKVLMQEMFEEELSKILEFHSSVEYGSNSLMDAWYNAFEKFVNIKNNLIPTYRALFESGYALNKPYGLLCYNHRAGGGDAVRLIPEEGETVLKKDFVGDTLWGRVYSDIQDKVQFVESDSRTQDTVYEDLLNGYHNGKELMYFPYFLLQIAYGCNAFNVSSTSKADDDDDEEDDYYHPYSKATTWTGYKSDSGYIEGYEDRLVVMLESVYKNILYKFLMETYVNNGLEVKSQAVDVQNTVKDFIDYATGCLKVCYLVPENVVVRSNGKDEVALRRLRFVNVGTPYTTDDFTNSILAVQSGVLGTEGNYLAPREDVLNANLKIVEFVYEGNRTLANALPLFAFKALDTLKRQGDVKKLPSWDNIILGKAADGSILSSKTSSIKLSNKIAHFLIAGSRSGKGVMTMNLLASAVQSGRPIFYLDGKPDVAAMLCFLANGMFAVNGGTYSKDDAVYKGGSELQFNGVVGKSCPEAISIFGTDFSSWYGSSGTFGDLVYLRTCMLLVSIVSCYYNGKKLADSDSIIVVIDEITETFRKLQPFFTRLETNVPPMKSKYTEFAGKKDGKGQADIDTNYSDVNMYSLAFLDSFYQTVKGMNEINGRGRHNELIPNIDMFVLGQTLNTQKAIADAYVEVPRKGELGIKKGGTGSAYAPGINILESLIELGEDGPTDLFLGANDKADYLAVDDASSKAHGKTDFTARQFGYFENLSYLDPVRSIINSADTSKVKKEACTLASKGTYFKPYLILKEGTEGSMPVNQMLGFLGNAGISADEVISDNEGKTEDGKGTGYFDERIGFREYIISLANGDESILDRLNKSGELMQWLVERMNYKGTWLEFITDFRPEWMFTLEDVKIAMDGGKTNLGDPSKMPILAEWYGIRPERFQGMGSKLAENGASASEYQAAGYQPDEPTAETVFSNADGIEEGLMNGSVGFGGGEPEEELDLSSAEDYDFGFSQEGEVEEVEEVKDDSYENASFDEMPEGATMDLEEEIVQASTNTVTEARESTEAYIENKNREAEVIANESKIIEKGLDDNYLGTQEFQNLSEGISVSFGIPREWAELIAKAEIQKMKSAGKVAEAGETGTDVVSKITQPLRANEICNGKPQFVQGEMVNRNPVDMPYKSMKGTFTDKDLGSDVSKMTWGNEETDVLNMEEIIDVITSGIVKALGSLDRIQSIGVCNESIVVNGALCNMDFGIPLDSVPFDLKSSIKNKKYARLFCWKVLYACPNLAKIECDSPQFFYNEISYELGFSGSSNNTAEMSRFFKAIPSLKVLVLGKKVLTPHDCESTWGYVSGVGRTQKTLTYSWDKSLDNWNTKRLAKRVKYLENDKISNGKKIMYCFGSYILVGSTSHVMRGMLKGINLVRGASAEKRNMANARRVADRYAE